MLAAALVASTFMAQAPVLASDVCVYNKAWFVLKWHAKNSDTGAVSPETKGYPVWDVKCQSLSKLGNLSAGDHVFPVVKAVWGKEITVSQPVYYDAVNASQVTYVCKGTTLNFHCDQEALPPTAANVTKAVGQFVEGFVEGLGMQIGFADCLQDINKTYGDAVAAVAFLESGFSIKKPASIVHAFQLIGQMSQDFATAITACESDASNVAAKLKALSLALSGDVYDIIKIVVDDAVHVWQDRKEISADCKTVSADWNAADYKGAGFAVGDIVGVIADGL